MGSAGFAAQASAASTPSAKAPTGPPLKIGFYYPVSANPVGSVLPMALSAARAAIRAINTSGGAHGSPLQLDFCDPKENPNTAAACARQFIADGDVAVAGSFSTQGGTVIVPALTAAGIPSLGVYPLAGADLTSPLAFPISGGSIAAFAAAPYFLKQAGAKKIFFPYVSGSAGALANEAYVKAGAAKVGSTFVGDVGIPGTAPDLSPYIATVKSSGADAVVLGIPEAQSIQFIEQAAQQGLNVKYEFIGFLPDNVQKLGPLLNNLVVPNPYPPATSATEQQFPTLKQFATEMAAEAKSGDQYAAQKYWFPIHTESPWFAVHFAANVINAIPKSQTVTPQTVLTVAQGVQHENPLGVGPSFNWTQPKIAKFPRLENTFVYWATIKNQKYVLVRNKPVDILAVSSFG